MKLKLHRGTYCAYGHFMRRPFTRQLDIRWRDKRLTVTLRLLPADPWRTPMCGKCLGIQ